MRWEYCSPLSAGEAAPPVDDGIPPMWRYHAERTVMSAPTVVVQLRSLSSMRVDFGPEEPVKQAVMMDCPRCMSQKMSDSSQVFESAYGGRLWIDYRDSIMPYNEDWMAGRIYVHYARPFSNPSSGEGSEIWGVVGLNETFETPFVHQRVHVCDMANHAMVVIGIEDEAAMSVRCITTSPSPPPPYKLRHRRRFPGRAKRI
eukprot:3954956-Prymnesium_polylepis.3